MDKIVWLARLIPILIARAVNFQETIAQKLSVTRERAEMQRRVGGQRISDLSCEKFKSDFTVLTSSYVYNA